MKLYLTAIKDKKAKVFQAFNFSPNLENAKRQFKIACGDSNSLLSKFTSDYDLYLIATIDDVCPDSSYSSSLKLLVSGKTVSDSEVIDNV